MIDCKLLTSCLTSILLVTPACFGDQGPAGGDGTGTGTGTDTGETGAGDDTDGGGGGGDTDGGDAGDDGGSDTGRDGGTGDGGTGDGGTGDGGTGTSDVGPPNILEISPADGDTGVTEDAVIIVTFSEPMDKAATQQAYQSADLPAGGVTFSWNEDGDVLTITPNDPLEYAEGTDPAETDPVTYAFSITDVAEDLEGESLSSTEMVTFSTLRRLVQELDPVYDLTGDVADLGGSDITVSLFAGNLSDDDISRIYATFDLEMLAEGLATVEVAEFTAAQSEAFGNPYEDLGTCDVQSIVYEEMNDALFDVDPVSDERITIFDAPDDVYVTVSVLDFVQADVKQGRSRSQLRMSFSTEVDMTPDSDTDGASVNKNTLSLAVTYLAP